MNNKTRIGGILKNSTLARISVIGLPDRPGMAAMILGALGNAPVSYTNLTLPTSELL